jgi:hypothetical protein
LSPHPVKHTLQGRQIAAIWIHSDPSNDRTVIAGMPRVIRAANALRRSVEICIHDSRYDDYSLIEAASVISEVLVPNNDSRCTAHHLDHRAPYGGMHIDRVV